MLILCKTYLDQKRLENETAPNNRFPNKAGGNIFKEHFEAKKKRKNLARKREPP